MKFANPLPNVTFMEWLGFLSATSIGALLFLNGITSTVVNELRNQGGEMDITIGKDSSIKTQQSRVSISIEKGDEVSVAIDGKQVRIHHVGGVWTIDHPAAVTSRTVPVGDN